MRTEDQRLQPAKPTGNNETTPKGITSRSAAMLRIVAEYTGSRPFPSLNLKQTFTALKYPNYRLWFMGQLVSLVGTWMQTTAQGYLVFQLTRSPAYLGYVGFAAGVPSWLFMLFGGVVADRLPRRNLLLITQITMMILAFIMAALTFSGVIQPWHIILLALALGVANAFDVPARQSFVLEMVERQDLTNAIALNSSMFNLATVTGPAVAGLTYALVGPAWCFAINGFSFLAVITALLKMRLQPSPNHTGRPQAALDDLKAGLRYVAANPSIQTLIGVAAIMSLFGMAYVTLIPAWAVTVLGGDSTTNGWLQSARGLGALGGALLIAAMGRISFKGKLLTLGTFVFPVMLLLFAVVRWFPLALLALMGVGWGFMILFNMANALIQTLVADEVRGRVMSIYTLGFFGLMPLGALLTGWVAEVFNEPTTLIISALISLGFAGWLWLYRPQLRALK
jgi:MFS family permease